MNAAPLAGGPELPFARGATGIELVDAAMTTDGDALIVYGDHAGCCGSEPPLFIRHRRGPRGTFGRAAAVVPADLRAQASGSIVSALHGSGNAVIAFARAAAGIEAFVRRGWGGPWKRVPVPDTAGIVSLQDPALTAAPDGAFDLLWFETTGAPVPSPTGTVRSARLEGESWRSMAPQPVPASRFRDWDLAPGGGALVTGVDDTGRVWATSRGAAGAPWEPVAEVGVVAPVSFPLPDVGVDAAIGRDGSLLPS